MRLSALLLLIFAAATQVAAAIPPTTDVPKAVTEVVNGKTLKLIGLQKDIDAYIEAKKAGLSVLSGDMPQNFQTMDQKVECRNTVTSDNGYDRGIFEGIDHLHSLADRGYNCVVGAHECVRITCAWDAMIMMCNNYDNVRWTSCHEIADAATAVKAACTALDHRVRGQVGTSVGIIVAVGGSFYHC